MSVEIQTADARLKTLSVTVQALTVSGKQMTLSVFRQLPVADVFVRYGRVENGNRLNQDFELWGKVNYQIKDQGNSWVVASNGGVLYRAPCKTGRFDLSCYDGAKKIINSVYVGSIINIIDKLKSNGAKGDYDIIKTINHGSIDDDLKADCIAFIDDRKSFVSTCNEELKKAEAVIESLPQLFIAV